MNDPFLEFDDVEYNGAFVISRKAREAISRLMAEHHLTKMVDPGGEELTGVGFRCRLTGLDDVADYRTLRAALESYLPPF